MRSSVCISPRITARCLAESTVLVYRVVRKPPNSVSMTRSVHRFTDDSSWSLYLTSLATEVMSRSYLRQNCSRSGTRAIVPSRFITSQMTPAGVSPASRARSTAASVWPRRSSTSPSRARSGNIWPGRHRSDGRHDGSTAWRMVLLRSCAEIPVVVPYRESIDSQKAVPKFEVLTRHIIGRPSLSQ